MDVKSAEPSPKRESDAVASDGEQQAETSPPNLATTGTAEAATYDEQYEEDDSGSDGDETRDISEDSDYGGSADASPVPAKNRTRGQRKLGGSRKGRKCQRWTPRQELAAVEAMVEIRAEGEVFGDAAFEEAHRRLVARLPNWNHTVSGIYNAWHRRKLVNKVIRAEAKIAQEKRLQQEQEDEALGLTITGKGTLKRKSTGGLTTPKKHEHAAHNADEDTDEEAVPTSKRSRTLSFGSSARPGLRNPTTNLSYDLSQTSLFTTPATTSRAPAPDVPYFPTVTVGFKRYNNNSRRIRDFSYVNNMQGFWNQVVATPMFPNLDTASMVVTVLINESQKPHYMAHHDKIDYANFLQLVGKAVDAAGDEEVVVNVEAAS